MSKAQGSEKFSWLLFKGAPKRCWECGKEPLRIKDVGQHRHRYPGRRTEFLCRQCQQRHVQELVKRTRLELGLDGP